MTKKANDPFIGARLGDYVIEDLVGRGGMARVYRGIDVNLERPAAVKVLEISDHSDDDRLIERFKLEAKAIARFEQPNIVPIYQYGENEDGTQFFIAMKLVEGGTLSTVLKANRRTDELLPPERILEIVRDVCSALDYAHERNIIHRDIKPSNILFEASQNDRAILTDFGLAMEAGGGSTLGTAFGTPRYISPEQAMSSQKAVPQSDIYSLGVVVYEMLTGRVPFQDDSAMSIALYHITTPPPPPRSLNPDIPAAVEACVLKALAKEPDARYKTANDFYKALAKAYEGHEVELATPRQPPAPVTAEGESDTHTHNAADLDGDTAVMDAVQARRRSRLPLLLALLVVLLLSVAVVVALGGAAPPGSAPTPAPVTLYELPADATVTARLIFDEDRLAVYNTDDAYALPVMDISLRVGETTYEMANFNEPRGHGALPPGECAWLRLLSEPLQTPPPPCPHPAYHIQLLDDEAALFWVAAEDGPESIDVLVAGEVVQTCLLEGGRCEFTVP